MPGATTGGDYSELEAPAVWRKGRESAQQRVGAAEDIGQDHYNIPTFLRKQAD
jgi:cell division protein FtsZ